MEVGRVALELVVGFAAGVFAGVTGAGGGILMVPILVLLGLPALSATATSNLAIIVTATSGTVTNTTRFGLPWRRVIILAIPAVVLAPLGVVLARQMSETLLLLAFAAFCLLSIGILQSRLSLADVAAGDDQGTPPSASLVASVGTGASGGVLAGLFGVGGGLIMVPLQSLLLSTPVRLASRISLAVVLFAGIAAVVTHEASGGDVRWISGLVLGIGGLLGAPVGAHWLHRLTDRQSTRVIQGTMLLVAGSLVWRALG